MKTIYHNFSDTVKFGTACHFLLCFWMSTQRGIADIPCPIALYWSV
jgi:hypothetical protein